MRLLPVGQMGGLAGIAQAEIVAARGGYPNLYSSVRGNEFDVKDFGPVGTSDDTATFQAAVNFASALGGGIVNYGGGTFLLDGLVMINCVTLQGAGTTRSYLKAKSGGAAAAVLLLDIGPVQGMWVQDCTVVPNGNAGQMGIYFQSVASTGSPFHGGWWYGGLRRVTVNGFAWHNIWLRGGGVSSLLPHQFLELDLVQSYCSATGSALLMTGQVGQVNFIGGEYDGPGLASGTTNKVNIRLYREVQNDGITVVSDEHPYAINLLGVTTQSNKQGILIDRANPVSILGCYFETIGQAITAQTSASMVIAEGCQFDNAGFVGDGSGYIVSTQGITVVAFDHNEISGNVETHFANGSGSAIFLNGNLLAATEVSTGLTIQIAVASNAIAMGLAKTALVNASANAIKNITSSLGVGEMLFVRATGGTILFDTSGNIWLGNHTGLIAGDSTACFIRFDLGGFIWNLVSVSA